VKHYGFRETIRDDVRGRSRLSILGEVFGLVVILGAIIAGYIVLASTGRFG
jgi:hypothetical protein